MLWKEKFESIDKSYDSLSNIVRENQKLILDTIESLKQYYDLVIDDLKEQLKEKQSDIDKLKKFVDDQKKNNATILSTLEANTSATNSSYEHFTKECNRIEESDKQTFDALNKKINIVAGSLPEPSKSQAMNELYPKVADK